jgi:putative membrane protein
MPFANIPPASILFGSYLFLWSAMALSPVDWNNWVLASVIPAIVVGGLVAGRRVLPLSGASYLLIGVFVALHTIGAHYTYARVPLGHWLSLTLGDGRNDYDRIVHFAFGLLLAYPMQEVFARLGNVRGFLLYYLPGMTLVGLSGLWEVLESWVARIASPELGAAYLGSQGDVWDAQKDIAAAFYGVLLWLALSVLASRRVASHAAEVPSRGPSAPAAAPRP